MSPAIEIRDAFRIYRAERAAAVALQGLSLRVDEGEIVVVLGPSGSGKTTLLRVLAGFDALSAGSVRVLGTNLPGSPSALAEFRARNLGLLDQHYARALSPYLSCAHSVALTLELLGDPRRPARAAAAALLERVGLRDRVAAWPASLSGGEQQRVALCASLVHRPRLLLADEPAGELDAENAQTVYALIAELVREQGGSALIVSHDDAAATIADRLIHVRDGRVVEERTPGQTATLVVTEPGWIRLPDPLLEAIGHPRRLRAKLQDQTVELTSAAAATPRSTHTAAAALRPALPPPAVVASLRNVTRRYGTSQKPVLDGLSQGFESGRFHAVVGRSGSGKTTLLHLLAGLDRPDDGEVLIDGYETSGMSRAAIATLRREHIALVTQEPGLVPHLSARENVALAVQLRAAAEDADGRATRALIDVGLGERLDHRADQLSAGERQRVAIARAVAVRTTILLADEPTARLDHANARAVGELLSQLAHSGGTAVICATHDRTLIGLADAQLTLDAGALTLAQAATAGQ
jgi:ABC-type lipoprotein export system ATPase subunit